VLWIDGKGRLGMRGFDQRRDGFFSYVRPESRIPKDHPLRLIRCVADEALKVLDDQFAALYSENGRPSIPPEQLLRALLLQAFYTIRSERQLMEQLNYNLLFRWFVGLSVDDPVWVPTVFSHNRDRLLEGDIAAAFMAAVLNLARVKALLSDEHFSVYGKLIQAWATLAQGSAKRSLVEWPEEGSMKSFRRKDGNDEPPAPGRNGERNFRKEPRSNETHASTTDPDARLARKSNGQEARLAFTGHLVMENRAGLVVNACLTYATGTAEPAAALAMLEALPGAGHKTVGADKNYDTAKFVAESRAIGVTPHGTQNITTHRGSNIDGRTTWHAGYRISQIVRKRIEEANGWIKEVGGMAQTKLRGAEQVEWSFVFKAAAYNLIRLPWLLATG
jgi:transposase